MHTLGGQLASIQSLLEAVMDVYSKGIRSILHCRYKKKHFPKLKSIRKAPESTKNTSTVLMAYTHHNNARTSVLEAELYCMHAVVMVS